MCCIRALIFAFPMLLLLVGTTLAADPSWP
jgi:hypothetical protein